MTFFTRASVLVLFATASLVSAAACSSKSDPSGTCDTVLPCRLANDAGLCSGPVVQSGVCESCPAGYVDVSACTNDDAGPPSKNDGGQDAASDADAVPEASCGVITLCFPVSDAGVCGAEVNSAPCEPCPTGLVPSNDCKSFEDAGPSSGNDAGQDATSDAPEKDAASDADAVPEASCGVITLCFPVSDAGVCGAEVNSAPCEPCPAGLVPSNDCKSFEDAGADASQ